MTQLAYIHKYEFKIQERVLASAEITNISPYLNT